VALQARLEAPALQEVLGRVDALPSPPKSLQALNTMLADRNTDVDAIARVVEGDVAMAAKVLQLVNSAFFGLPRAITNLRQAVSYLGLVNLRNVVATAGVFRAFPPQGALAGVLEEVEAHSTGTAAAARTLFADVLDRPTMEEVTVGAMLHDVGVLVLAAGLPDEMDSLLSTGLQGTERCQAERACFGADHATVGAYLLALWGLPIPIVEAVAWHHEAPSLPDPRLDAVHATYVADVLAAANESLDPTYVETLGVTALVQRWSADHTAVPRP
jgi:HD-like signal output (HDOD) protein